MNVEFFCMIHEGRCGSTVLSTLINQHPSILHFNEILTKKSWISPDFVGSDWEKKRDELSIKLCDLSEFVRILPDTNKARDKSTCKHIGFEIKLNQIQKNQLDCDLTSLVRNLEENIPGIRFLFLTRRNILRRHVSTLRCLFKEVSHAKDLAQVNYEKVVILPDTMRDWSYDFSNRHPSLVDLMEVSESRRNEVRAFAEARGDLYLEYEDFERDPMLGAAKIFDFLGVPYLAAQSPLLKTGDLPLSELIENYEDVRDSLLGTRWESMLD